ncbi:acyltransferase family protein [Rhizocola hellebori]|nr:acyltransferase [Rhizocola hellebori]
MTAVTPAELLPAHESTAAHQRDPYVDFLRALSLIVVVLWHWAFTILEWRDDGPHATSPLGFTRGLWLATWLFQVLPLFFFIGGYVHLKSWERAQSRGVKMHSFVLRRIRQLLIPATIVCFVWIALGSMIGAYFNLQGVGRAVKLVVSPLWFLAVYLCLVALLPLSLWLHRKAGMLAVIWLAGGAMLVDVIRFGKGIEEAGWLNMVLVWSLAHQAGYFYQKIVDAPRHNDWAVMWAGLFGLVGLVGSGLYPGTMVGVPGERFSNIGPPTFVIVALLLFQIGTAELLRPGMQIRLKRPRWERLNKLVNEFSLPLYLVHSTGMAVFLFLAWISFGIDMKKQAHVDLGWWLTRPLAIIGPLICTIPVLWLFRRIQNRAKKAAIEAREDSQTVVAS